MSSTKDDIQLFCRNLNEYVNNNTDFNLIGSEPALRKIMRAMSRLHNRNPILIGESGIGKTALVYGLAKKIEKGEVINHLLHKQIFELNIVALQADTKYRGDLEKRIDGVINFFSQNPSKILFIDEMHMAAMPMGDGADGLKLLNALKPKLEERSLQMIGATTEQEYSRYIGNDDALIRRFKTIVIKEPQYREAVTILMGIKKQFERHYGIKIPSSIIPPAVRIAHAFKHITRQALPAGVITILEDALSSLKLNIETKPDFIVDLEKRILSLKLEKESLKLEDDNVQVHKIQGINEQITALETELDEAELSWSNKVNAIHRVKELKASLDKLQTESLQLQTAGKFDEAGSILFKKMPEIETEIRAIEQEIGELNILTKPFLYKAFAESYGIPSSRVDPDFANKIEMLYEFLTDNLKGQDEPIKEVVKQLQIFLMGIQVRPMPATIFLVGATGTGKTQLARLVSRYMFEKEEEEVDGNNYGALVLNMSEYNNDHHISALIGSPPGYSGHKEGGLLTEAIRHNPSRVIVFDEIEKAHKSIFNLLLSAMDTGTIRDSNGRVYSLSKCILFFTSNCGQDSYFKSINSDKEAIAEQVIKSVKQVFPPEFFNRLSNVVVFNRISNEDAKEIVVLKMKQLIHKSNIDIEITWDPEVVDEILKLSFSYHYGARGVERCVLRTLGNYLSTKVFDKTIKSLHISVKDLFDAPTRVHM